MLFGSGTSNDPYPDPWEDPKAKSAICFSCNVIHGNYSGVHILLDPHWGLDGSHQHTPSSFNQAPCITTLHLGGGFTLY